MLNEKVLVFADESFHAKIEAKPFFDVPLHAHPFYEIILIKNGEGTCYTEGESLPFGPGDIFFWGTGIMHTLKCPEIYYSPNSPGTVAYVIHFEHQSVNAILGAIPEAAELEGLWEAIKKGVYLPRQENLKARELISELVEAKGLRKFILLLSVLESIAESNFTKILPSPPEPENTANQATKENPDKMEFIYQYVTKNYRQNLQVSHLAELSHMSVPSFCRKFKASFLKNFTQVLHEIRIGQAKKLFLQGKANIAEVAYLVGYNSPSYFSETFKQYTGETPKRFLAAMKFLQRTKMTQK